MTLYVQSSTRSRVDEQFWAAKIERILLEGKKLVFEPKADFQPKKLIFGPFSTYSLSSNPSELDCRGENSKKLSLFESYRISLAAASRDRSSFFGRFGALNI